MSRRASRGPAGEERRLEVQRTKCVACGEEMWVAYHNERKIMTLQGLCRLTLVVRRCRNTECPRYKRAYRPEEEGRFALPHGECGLDVIALVGTLRYQEHRSIKEIHQHLQARGVQVCERTVEHALHRYEELVSVHLHQKERLHKVFEKQGRVILAIDGLQPDVGHEVLWVIREVISGEILLARALLSSSQEDVASLLRSAKEMLPEHVPISGIVSDGQRSIRLAVARVFPHVAHQLCHFHYLREAAKPIYEADRHAKKELKKRVRGIRPIEASLQGHSDQESEVVRDYCLAVRSALTDDGHPPLAASGLKLYDRLCQIVASMARVAEKRGGLPKPLLRLQQLLKKALESTGTDWETLEQVYGWVHQLAHVLGEEDVPTEERQLRFLLILLPMQQQASQLEPRWQQAIGHFLKVTGSYAPHLFFCYQVADLPRTNNGLEQSFGSVRRSERRATGRRGAVPGLVVHGAVRVQAALATRVKTFTAHDLAPYDLHVWRTVRAEVSSRQESRCKQSRFRKDPAAYLADLERRLLSG